MDGGKLSEVNARTVPKRQNELVGKFKMTVGDLVSIRGQVFCSCFTEFEFCSLFWVQG